jgi:hypothetical protein
VQQRFDPKTGELGSEFWLSVVDTRSRGVEVLREPSGERNGARGKEGDGGDWWLLKGVRCSKMEGRGVRPGQCHADEGKRGRSGAPNGGWRAWSGRQWPGNSVRGHRQVASGCVAGDPWG